MTSGFSIRIENNTVNVKNFFQNIYDNMVVQNQEVEIVIEGLILNKKQILQNYALSDFSTLLLELYKNKKENLVKELEGEFRGYIYNKSEETLVVFTNPTATQRVFYTKKNGEIFVDTSLVRLAENLKKQNIKIDPDIDSFYQLLCIGNMLEDNTPIVGVKKILDGNLLQINLKTQNISQQAYYKPFSGNYFEKGKAKALGLMHDIFQKSVLLEYEKDAEIGKKSLALLSGGLDSRMGVFYALKNNLAPENILCFSQSDYLDHSISQKIAKDYQLHYEFIALDGGSYLNKIDQLTKISEGCGLFTGGIHVQYALDNLKYENFGIFHSGQIGDGILGGFNSEPFRKKPSHFKIIQQEKYLPKIEKNMSEIMANYDTEESFLLRNIAYNRTVLGAQVFQQKAYQTSPFMTKEMLDFAFSLPEDWKFKHQFYLEWIKKYMPESTNYRWERTLLKPDAVWKTQFGDKFLKPIFKRINEKILKTPEKSSMYPYAFYFEQSEELQKYYQNYFNENTCRLDGYKELQKDVSELFSSNSFYNKALALNILSIFKLYFD